MPVKLCKICGHIPRYMYDHMKDNHYSELEKGMMELGRIEVNLIVTPKQKYIHLPKNIRDKLDSFYDDFDANDVVAINCLTCNKYTQDDNEAIDCLMAEHEIFPYLKAKK